MPDNPRLVQTVEEMANLGIQMARSEDLVGLVPTMGSLHEGHLSLVRAARHQCDTVVVSVFVNPMQFGEGEDLDRYPRDLDSDLNLCAAEKADVVFAPTLDEMYPKDASTVVEVGRIDNTMCGISRPGHFRGVTTVVSKLFNLVRPDYAYFGQKDAQQLLIVRRLVRDLNFPIQIIACPIVREDSGLAMSSRNQALNEKQREAAACLHESLMLAKDLFDGGEILALRIIEEMAEIIIATPDVELDYVSVVDPDTMEDVTEIDRPVLVALAVWIGQTRLIDNIVLPDGVL